MVSSFIHPSVGVIRPHQYIHAGSRPGVELYGILFCFFYVVLEYNNFDGTRPSSMDRWDIGGSLGPMAPSAMYTCTRELCEDDELTFGSARRTSYITIVIGDLTLVLSQHLAVIKTLL